MITDVEGGCFMCVEVALGSLGFGGKGGTLDVPPGARVQGPQSRTLQLGTQTLTSPVAVRAKAGYRLSSGLLPLVPFLIPCSTIPSLFIPDLLSIPSFSFLDSTICHFVPLFLTSPVLQNAVSL